MFCTHLNYKQNWSISFSFNCACVVKPLAGQTVQTWHSLACAVKTEGKTVRAWGSLGAFAKLSCLYVRPSVLRRCSEGQVATSFVILEELSFGLNLIIFVWGKSHAYDTHCSFSKTRLTYTNYTLQLLDRSLKCSFLLQETHVSNCLWSSGSEKSEGNAKSNAWKSHEFCNTF